MAVQTVTRTTCDRCPRVIEEVGATKLNNDGPPKPLLYMEGAGELFQEPIKFDDLCDKCITRVTHLVKQLRLEKDEGTDEKDEGTDDKKAASKDNASKKPNKDKDKDKGKDKGSADAAPPPS